MPFREKSAWIMSVALLTGCLLYVPTVMSGWSDSGTLISPQIPHVLTYTACLVSVAIVGHIAVAVIAPKDASTAIDERERHIFGRAARYSGYVTATGIVLSLGVYLLSGSGDLLFYAAFASLMVGQIAEYLLQILFFRVSV